MPLNPAMEAVAAEAIEALARELDALAIWLMEKCDENDPRPGLAFNAATVVRALAGERAHFEEIVVAEIKHHTDQGKLDPERQAYHRERIAALAPGDDESLD